LNNGFLRKSPIPLRPLPLNRLSSPPAPAPAPPAVTLATGPKLPTEVGVKAQKEREDILAAQEANRQSQIMNPLAAQFQQGKISAQGAELPGLFAQSRSLTNKADTEDATKESTIAKTNSANELAIQGDRLKQMTTRQQAANQIVSQIIAQGPVAGEAYRRQLEAQNPEIKQIFGNIPTAQLPQAMAHANQWLNQQDEKYQQMKMQVEERAKSAKYTADSASRTTLTGKQMEIDAGKYDKKEGGKSMYQSFQSMSPDKRIGITSMALESGFNPFTQEPLTPEQKLQFKALLDQDTRTLDAKGAAGRVAGKVDTGQVTGLPTNPVPSVGAPQLLPGTAIEHSGKKWTYIGGPKDQKSSWKQQ